MNFCQEERLKIRRILENTTNIQSLQSLKELATAYHLIGMIAKKIVTIIAGDANAIEKVFSITGCEILNDIEFEDHLKWKKRLMAIDDVEEVRELAISLSDNGWKTLEILDNMNHGKLKLAIGETQVK